MCMYACVNPRYNGKCKTYLNLLRISRLRKKSSQTLFFQKTRKKNEMNLCEYFLLFFSLFLKYYHTHITQCPPPPPSPSHRNRLLLREKEERRKRKTKRRGWCERRCERRARFVCSFFIIIIRVFFVFPSSLCFCVSKRSAKLSLSLSYSLSDRAGPLNDYTNSSKRF